MSLYLRLVIGPVVVCDIELFGTTQPDGDEPPAQLAGGTGTLAYPEPVEDIDAFGFRSPRRKP